VPKTSCKAPSARHAGGSSCERNLGVTLIFKIGEADAKAILKQAAKAGLRSGAKISSAAARPFIPRAPVSTEDAEATGNGWPRSNSNYFVDLLQRPTLSLGECGQDHRQAFATGLIRHGPSVRSLQASASSSRTENSRWGRPSPLCGIGQMGCRFEVQRSSSLCCPAWAPTAHIIITRGFLSYFVHRTNLRCERSAGEYGALRNRIHLKTFDRSMSLWTTLNRR
jgi:hypothetical protein